MCSDGYFIAQQATHRIKEKDRTMKLLKSKRQAQPANRFEEFLQNQPVFNWFSRYETATSSPAKAVEQCSSCSSWMAKRAGNQ